MADFFRLENATISQKQSVKQESKLRPEIFSKFKSFSSALVERVYDGYKFYESSASIAYRMFYHFFQLANGSTIASIICD